MLKKLLLTLVPLVLLSIVALVLYNPIERAREARDDQRLADLRLLKTSLDYYISQNANIGANLCAGCQLGKDVFVYHRALLPAGNLRITQSRFVNGQGWVPVDFSLNAPLFSTPLALLPVDPLEKTRSVRQSLPILNGFYPKDKENFVYTFTPGANGKYKLTAKMESKKGLQKAANDGGDLADRYEVGDLSLVP